jgi:hypothetical protein
VGSLPHINVKIKVGQYRTPCWRDTNYFLLEVHLINDLPDDSMQQAMPTSRAIVKRGFLERFWSGKYLLH